MNGMHRILYAINMYIIIVIARYLWRKPWLAMSAIKRIVLFVQMNYDGQMFVTAYGVVYTSSTV